MNKQLRWLVAPFLVFSIMACMCSGLSGLQSLGSGLQAAASQLPSVLTSMPTDLGPMETMSAQQSSASGTTTPGHLGIALNTIKTVLQMTQQFTFTDGTVDGQPDSTAKLAGSLASSMPDLAAGFSADFIGDPTNLTRIRITMPWTGNNASTQQMIGIVNVLVTSFLPGNVSSSFTPWLTQNLSTLTPGNQTQTTIQNFVFTLERTSSTMTLTIDPAQ